MTEPVRLKLKAGVDAVAFLGELAKLGGGNRGVQNNRALLLRR